MFKGMEGRSMHIIGIIENGFNPTKCCEAILGYQLSRSFLVLIAFGNLVVCLSAPMHIDVLLGSNRLAASTSFSNPATDLKAALVAPHSPCCMILHVMMHLPKSLVTRLLPVPPALEEIGTLRHLPTVKA